MGLCALSLRPFRVRDSLKLPVMRCPPVRLCAAAKLPKIDI